jgi:NADPH-dependent glutamate synthase beta subunit-like oxidoreductase/NAD(P)H-flavin reductase
MTHVSLSTPRTADPSWNLRLGVPGFRFADLNRVRRLAALDQVFRDELRGADPTLSAEYEAYRAARGEGYEAVRASEILVRVGAHVGPFVARLFRIESEYEALQRRTLDENRVFDWKKRVLDKRVLRPHPKPDELAAFDVAALEAAYRAIVAGRIGATFQGDPERELAEAGLSALDTPAELAAIVAWARALAFHPNVKARAAGWASFKVPEPTDYENLVRVERDPALPERLFGPEATRRRRDGFKLTDPRMVLRQVTQEVHYCIYCHERDKDSCSKGYRKAGEIQKNPLGITLDGCPLDEKISEAHLLKHHGHVLGALATVMIDNPLCAGTGHRICNDCMKACIFQKQEPVNIPQIETGILTDVLKLPYGFEIYALLTRWNPLNVRRPVPLRYNGKHVLVVGMGPAGYTLAHHLLNEGFGVVGIDGLRIEPIPIELRGAKRRVPKPIKEIAEIARPLDERTILGFGGVSEYGITVRWDKSFLDVNYLVLMRRKKFRLYDGVRFGGTLTLDDAWRLGFDHVAIASGAGRPTLLAVKNNMLRGMRQASDFLMGLQASGAYKKNTLVNVQVDLPAVVVGGGLTAIDTATELIAYYIVQVEKTVDRFERLVPRIGEAAMWSRFDEEERETVQRWLDHGRAVRAEREAAAAAGRAPDFARLAREWGGVTIAYRRRLQDSPAYRLNHEEVIKALEEGIGFAESLSPTECVPDRWGKVQAVRFERQRLVEGKLKGTGEIVELPARSVMVAAGTHPNVIYERECPGTFALDKWGEFFVSHRRVGGTLVPAAPGEIGFFTSYEKEGRLVSFYGDNHPEYAGNVVKAMASAKHGYAHVAALFADDVAQQREDEQAERELEWVRLADRLDDQLVSKVVDVLRLTPQIVEVVVRSPLAARQFRPGQFFRLQNYDSSAEQVAGFNLTMEGVALTGAWVDREQGLVSLIALEMGGSSRLCTLLHPGDEVVLMGPTGTPTEIPEGETVLLAGGGLGNAVLFSIAQALKERGNRVLYFAGYKKKSDLYKRKEIERATDVVIWSVDGGDAIEPRRAQDRTFSGNIVQAMHAYGRGDLGEPPIHLHEVQRVISIGSDRMMNAVKVARKGVLGDLLRADHQAIGSINSPMQCMMKEICAQCLQRHVDPASGKEEMVFSCFNQDQSLDSVDFEHLAARLRQNSVAEKLTSLWIDHLFERRDVEAV